MKVRRHRHWELQEPQPGIQLWMLAAAAAVVLQDLFLRPTRAVELGMLLWPLVQQRLTVMEVTGHWLSRCVCQLGPQGLRPP